MKKKKKKNKDTNIEMPKGIEQRIKDYLETHVTAGGLYALTIDDESFLPGLMEVIEDPNEYWTDMRKPFLIDMEKDKYNKYNPDRILQAAEKLGEIRKQNASKDYEELVDLSKNWIEAKNIETILTVKTKLNWLQKFLCFVPRVKPVLEYECMISFDVSTEDFKKLTSNAILRATDGTMFMVKVRATSELTNTVEADSLNTVTHKPL